MDIFDIFAAASFEYAVYLNLAATDLTIDMASPLHVLPQPCILPDFPFIVIAYFHLIVVCNLKKWWPP